MRRIEDALERQLEVPDRPVRIVSLVPSLTELLFALGAGPRVAGVSRYCAEPADPLRGVPRVGGPKDPDVAAIAALDPDLVLAVKEENRARDVEELAARVPVYVADVRSVDDALALVGETADLVDGEPARAEALRRSMQEGVEEARRIAAGAPLLPIFCPVWRDPWITVSRDTYMYDVIRICGGEAISPGRHEGRYPRVRLDEVRAARPRLVLLPDEPYAFGPRDAAELSTLLAPARSEGTTPQRVALPLPPDVPGPPVEEPVDGRAQGGLPVCLIDGKLLGWYGPRLAAVATVARRIRAARDERVDMRSP